MVWFPKDTGDSSVEKFERTFYKARKAALKTWQGDDYESSNDEIPLQEPRQRKRAKEVTQEELAAEEATAAEAIAACGATDEKHAARVRSDPAFVENGRRRTLKQQESQDRYELAHHFTYGRDHEIDFSPRTNKNDPELLYGHPTINEVKATEEFVEDPDEGEWMEYLNDEGNPILDQHGNPMYVPFEPERSLRQKVSKPKMPGKSSEPKQTAKKEVSKKQVPQKRKAAHQLTTETTELDNQDEMIID